MIIEYPHVNINWTKKGKIDKISRYAIPRVKVKCDKCGKEFLEKEPVFNHRLKLINKEYCGQCSRPLVCSLGGIKGNYDENGNLKQNSGQFSTEKWDSLSDKELKKKKKHNKEIAINFHKLLKQNPDKKTEHYKKVFKNSVIGYISKGQQEIYSIIKNDGYEIDGYISGMRIDIINKEKKIAIEYNGDFWHCNPRFWCENEYNDAIKMTAKDKWNNDRRRRFALRKLGYDVHVIWESDWTNNRNKIYALLNKITNKDYKFEKWIPKETKPLKGRTFEDIYGVEKAKQLKQNMSLRQRGRTVKQKTINKITTPKQGVFYVTRLKDWYKIIKNSHSKLLKYSRTPNNDNNKIWDGTEIILILDVKCPYCGLIGKGCNSNMTRYHFDNCKQKLKNK